MTNRGTKLVVTIGTVSVVLGALACSGSDNPAVAPGDAGTDALLQSEGGPAVDGGSSGVIVPDGGTELCNPEAPIDYARYLYKPPKIVAGACRTSEIEDLVAHVKANSTATVDAIYAYAKGKYGAACTSCMFAPATDATWAPFLLQNDQVVSLNESGCVEIVSGKGEECGRAHRQWDQCIEEGCAGCAATARQSCLSGVQGKACKGSTDNVTAICGAAINNFTQTCRAFDERIRRHCG